MQIGEAVLSVLVLIVIIIAISFLFMHQTTEFYVESKKLEVIISRYNEDLSWLQRPEFDGIHITCYNKGPNPPNTYGRDCNIINLPNVGRCDHTYLYHISTNYDKLANVTLFFPASCFDGHKACVTLNVIKKAKLTEDTVLPSVFGNHEDVRMDMYNFTIDNWKATNADNIAINSEDALQKSPIRPFGAWFDHNFPDHPPYRVVCYYGIFAVSKEHIMQHSVSRYESLMAYLDNHSNPEVGHYMERSWGAVFYPYPDSCIVGVDPC